MQVETQYTNGRSITFIVPDGPIEADELKDIAREGQPLEAILESSGLYLYPYLKITNPNPEGAK